jgi:hypothetical protein
MSSHREAPEISKDPVADSTDVYAFVSPDRPDTVTILANYLPLQGPAGGPNFYEFGDDVRYEINITNGHDVRAAVTYTFDFRTHVVNPDSFLYNTGPITSLDSPSWNRRQTYTVTRTVRTRRGTRSTVVARRVPSPPVNIGPRSTPDYESLAADAVRPLAGGRGLVFAGQRREGFYVDLGSIFDLGTLRPFQAAHLIPSAAAVGVNATKDLNVHTIALQVPITDLFASGKRPTSVDDPSATVGVWTAAYRRRARVFDRRDSRFEGNGGFQQVSRLANPLVNELLIPLGRKDRWNASPPSGDASFRQYVVRPELARLLPVLYPGVFPNLAALTAERADLAAILLTGLPAGIVPGFQNFTGPTPADLLRLNVAVPPAATPNPFGVVGGDLAGFPNGRRVGDNVVAIELRAVAGLTYPLVDPSFVPDAAASQLTDGTTPTPFLSSFPYLDIPLSGYDVPAAA